MSHRHHVQQRRFRTFRPPERDCIILILTEYDYWQDERGNRFQVVARVLTTDGWQEYNPDHPLSIPNLPFINGIDMVRGDWLDKKLADYTVFISSMLDLESSGNQEDQGDDAEDSQQSPNDVISHHDRSVPTPGQNETGDITGNNHPLDTGDNTMKGQSDHG